MNVTEYTLKGCEFIRSDLLKSSEESSEEESSEEESSEEESSEESSSQKNKYTIKKPRNQHYFSVLKNERLFYLVLNKPIIFELEKDNVIVDPAGLDYILSNSMNGAGGGSEVIYDLLKKNTFDKNVVNFFKLKGLKYFDEPIRDKKENEKLYLSGNKINTDITPSKVGLYRLKDKDDKINIIHTVGPKFSGNIALINILENDDESKLNQIYYKIYESIFKEFVSIENHKKLYLRLLPVSIGIYLPSKNKINNQKKILNAINIALFKLLNQPEYQHLIEKISLYLYEKSEYDIYESLYI